MRHSSDQFNSSSEPRNARTDDVAAELLADDRTFAQLAAWLERDLHRLEQRFVDYWTVESLRSGKKR